MRRTETLILILLLTAAAILASGPLDETDTFWHLASGRYILEHGRLPEPDPFTFNAGDRPDVHHEWLSQVVLALVERAAGLGGLRALRAILVAAALGIGFWALWLRSRNFLLVLAGLVLWWVLLAPNATIRPHLIGWVLALLVWGIGFAPPPPWSRKRRLIVLALLVLWANLHSSVLFIPAMLAVRLVGLLLEGLLRRSWDRPSLRHHALWLGASLLACLAQPAGFRLFPYVLSTPSLNRGLSVEWLPLFAADVRAHHPALLLAFALLAAWVVLAAWTGLALRRWRPSITFPALLVASATLYLAADTRRMTFFLFPAVFLAVEETSRLLEGRRRLPKTVALAFSLALVALGVLSNRAPGYVIFTRANLVPRYFPEKAAGFLAESRLQGWMYNMVTWGGYLSYRLSPVYRTFADGRWNLVGRQAILDAEQILSRKGNVEGLLDRYAIDFFIQPATRYFHSPPLDGRRWVLAYNDETAVVLIKRTARFQENLERICEYYRRLPEGIAHAHWLFSMQNSLGTRVPNPIPAAVDLCGEAPATRP